MKAFSFSDSQDAVDGTNKQLISKRRHARRIGGAHTVWKEEEGKDTEEHCEYPFCEDEPSCPYMLA
jgi:hypothetical protein